jgi:hypothetical protein
MHITSRQILYYLGRNEAPNIPNGDSLIGGDFIVGWDGFRGVVR